MKSDKLYKAIGEIDDDIIVKSNISMRARTKSTWGKWMSIAACFIVLFGIIFLIQKEYNPSLPMLTIPENIDSYGFEGYMAYDISELANGNPWNDSISIDKLPVYKNQVTCDGAGVPLTGLTVDEMTAKVKQTAKVLGITIGEMVTIPTAQENENAQNQGAVVYETPYEVQASGDGIKIRVDALNVISVFFEKPIKLPKDYSFTYHDTSYEQATNTLSYLIREYQGLLGFESPVFDLFGHYNIYGDRSFSYGVFENRGSIIERMESYAFNCATFSPNHDGELSVIHLYHADLSEKVGEYPIITPAKARKLLLKGKYASSVPFEIPGEECVAKVELVYRNSRWEQYFMPYYRFYVELPEEQSENGLKHYGIYYVPAVEEEYISNMPTYDGWFN